MNEYDVIYLSPWYDNKEDTGSEHLQNVIADIPLQDKTQLQAGKAT